MLSNRRLLVVALAGALVGAGCLGLGTEAGEDQSEREQEAEPTSTEEDTSEDRPSETPDANETERLRWEAVAFEGQLGVEATACSLVACAGTFTCVGPPLCGTPVRDPRVDRSFEVEHTGPVEEANLTLTWDAVSPVTEQLRFGIAWDCEDDCSYEYVEGTSPLSLELSRLDIEGDLYAWVWTPDQSTEDDPIVVHTTHDQPFEIEGAVAVTQGS